MKGSINRFRLSARRRLGAALAAVALLALPGPQPAHAAAFPDKPVKLVVPFAPGAAADTIGRLIGARLGAMWGQTVIVENRPGAGTIIGTEFVAKAPPDGYTLLLITPSFIINGTGARSLPYDSIKDFTPISLFAQTAMVLVLNPAVPANNVKELMALAHAHPNALNFASSGIGSPTQLGLEIFKLYGAPMTHVPYGGASPALADLLGGHVQMMLTSIIAAGPLIKQGKLKALAVTTPQRSPALPEVPAMAETIPGYEVENWWGITAPAHVPAAIADKIAADLKKVLQDPQVRDRLAREGADPVGDTPAQFAAYIEQDIAKWRKVVRETGAKID
jgi:tripartite-type tricarboxylate transporter receptor subunit TctC